MRNCFWQAQTINKQRKINMITTAKIGTQNLRK